MTDASFAWEDIVLGATEDSGFYRLETAELIAFAAQYDPRPVHLDPAEAKATSYGGLIAAGGHMLAIRQRLLADFAWKTAVIVSIGHDEVRFVGPLRGGSTCQVRIEWLDKRATSKPDRGVATVGITLLADGAPVMTMKDIILMKRRTAPVSEDKAEA
jgi:acyl dehydratase